MFEKGFLIFRAYHKMQLDMRDLLCSYAKTEWTEKILRQLEMQRTVATLSDKCEEAYTDICYGKTTWTLQSANTTGRGDEF